jgi:hypothetical protein
MKVNPARMSGARIGAAGPITSANAIRDPSPGASARSA